MSNKSINMFYRTYMLRGLTCYYGNHYFTYMRADLLA